jgi:hypothetical protein
MATPSSTIRADFLDDLEPWERLKAKVAERVEQGQIAYVTASEHHELLQALVKPDQHICSGSLWMFDLSRVAMLKDFLDQQGIRIGRYPPPAPSNKPGTFAESVRHWDFKYW